jgi:hypothetical protein
VLPKIHGGLCVEASGVQRAGFRVEETKVRDHTVKCCCSFAYSALTSFRGGCRGRGLSRG